MDVDCSMGTAWEKACMSAAGAMKNVEENTYRGLVAIVDNDIASGLDGGLSGNLQAR